MAVVLRVSSAVKEWKRVNTNLGGLEDDDGGEEQKEEKKGKKDKKGEALAHVRMPVV